MARPSAKFQIIGLDKMLSNLDNYYDKIVVELDNEMESAFVNMTTTAKQIFPNPENPKDKPEYSDIRSSIRYKKNKTLDYSLIAGRGSDPQNPKQALPAYIEFGTGRYFPQYPGKDKEWQTLAKEYYKNGRGWLRPSPYFYPTFTSWMRVLISNMQRILDRNERL